MCGRGQRAEASESQPRPVSDGGARLDSKGPSKAQVPPTAPRPARPARRAARTAVRIAVPQPSLRVGAERQRLKLAIGLSLLLHVLLFSLTFGGQGQGLPGLGFPWQERRVAAPDLRLVLIPAPPGAAAQAANSVKVPLKQQALIERALAGGPAPAPPQAASALTLLPPAVAIAAKAQVKAATNVAAPVQTIPEAAILAPVATPPLRTEAAAELPPIPTPVPKVMTVDRSDEPNVNLPVVPPVPAPVMAAAPSASSPEIAKTAPRDTVGIALQQAETETRQRAAELGRLERAEQASQRLAAQQEAARVAAAKLEAERRDATRQEAARREAEQAQAARLEAERPEATRQAAARQEVARLEAARGELERAEAAKLEADRLEVTRQAVARQETARREAERVQTARLEAERQEAARQAVARQQASQQASQQEVLRLQSLQADDARREASRRAMGRQLDEEAARRDAAAAAAASQAASGPALSSGSARRGRLFGRADANAELVLYAEAWARKIQLNMTLDLVRDAAKRPHNDPLVTVAIRSDGSVESVTFVRSSGVAEIDEAVRRIVRSQTPYQAFPPGLAREFDVIEIRRTWHFDTAIRLY